MDPLSKAFLDEVTKLAEPPPPKGVSVKKWDRILSGKEKDSSIDDLEAPPSRSLMPFLSKVHGLNKGSSWMDVGPDNSPDRPWVMPGKRKHAALSPERLAKLQQAMKKALKRNADSDVFSQLSGLTRPKHRKGFVKRVLLMTQKTKVAYKLQGHTEVGGLRIAIENRKGSVRKGKSREGVEWRTKMVNPYGYIVGTEGKDGDAVDAYVGPNKDAPKAFVVHQHKPDGTGYDEDKVMLGFPSKAAATKAFLKHYDSKKFLGPISIVTMDRLRELVASKRKLVKISSAGEPARRSRLVRSAGPGIGGLLGAGVGAALGAKKGKLLKGAIAGLGTGATLGWTPAMAHDAIKAIKRYRRGR